MIDHLTGDQWHQFEHQGYLRLGRLLNDADLFKLQQRVDDIMMGRADVNYDRMLMQLDEGKEDARRSLPQSIGYKGATLNYRKILHMELDSEYLAYIRRPLFQAICARAYGPATAIACYRTMFFNKPATGGTPLNWHQDRWDWLDRDPVITVWTALDAATRANGCVRVARGGHKQPLDPPFPGCTMPQDEEILARLPAAHVDYLEAEPGEAILLHTHLPHASGINTTGKPRRGLSVVYMDAATSSERDLPFTTLFGSGV
jgi:phytanoyl-CoA hydroxylase